MLSAVLPSMSVVAARQSQIPLASRERVRRMSVARVAMVGRTGRVEFKAWVKMAVVEVRAERASC